MTGMAGVIDGLRWFQVRPTLHVETLEPFTVTLNPQPEIWFSVHKSLDAYVSEPPLPLMLANTQEVLHSSLP